MAIGPTVRRRRLGAELRRLRERSGLKLEDAAANIELNASTLSRIETGKAPIKTGYMTKIFEMYHVVDPEVQQLLITMAREGHRKGWWADYDDVLPSGFDIYVGLEAEASSLRSYESNLVHGLLQTTDYAAAVLRELRPRASDDQIGRLVDLRVKRQKHLLDERNLPDESPLDLWLILEESAIRRIIGGTAVMRAQLESLIQASQASQRHLAGDGV